MPTTHYAESFQEGQSFLSSGRQVTEADVRIQCGTVGGTHPLHMDPIYCATRPDVGRCISPGCLVLGIVEGFFCKDIVPDEYIYSQPSRFQKVRFLKPIFIDDVIHAVFKVKETAPLDDFSGEVLFEISVYNQNEEIVTYIEEGFRIEKKDKGA